VITMHRIRWRAAASAVALVTVALVAVALVASGCSSDGSGQVESGPGGNDVGQLGAVLQPGDPIADGFVVAEGTSVPGGAFPTLGATYDGIPDQRSWSAVVESDMDLPAMFAAYVDQAIALGYTVHGFEAGTTPEQAAATGCSANLSEPNDLPDQPPPGTPLRVECGATAERIVDGALESVEIRGARSYEAQAEWPIDHFGLSLLRWPRERGADPLLPPNPEPTVPTPPLPPAPPVSTVPEVTEGEAPIDCSAPVAIEPGSRLLGIGFDCSWGAYDMVVEVTGDPAEVFEAYVAQIGSAQGFNPPVEHESPSEFDGRAVESAAIWADGSSMLRLAMLSGDDRNPVILVEHLSG
jgi:hypothetical protein